MNKIIIACVTSLALAGCTSTGQISKAAIGAGVGAATGAGIGALAGGKNKGKAALIGAAAGTALGAGIGYYMDSQEKDLKAAVQGTPVQVQRQGDNIAIIMPGNIAFATGSAELSSSFYPSLDAVADVLLKSPDTTLTIAGHTDSVGNADTNKQLSQKRADAVASYLVTKGINSQRIQAIGYGDTRPVAANDTEEGRSKNRRVVIQILPKKQ